MKLGKARVQSIGLFGKLPLILFTETFCICLATSAQYPGPTLILWGCSQVSFCLNLTHMTKEPHSALGWLVWALGKWCFSRLPGSRRRPTVLRPDESVVPTSHLEVAVLAGPLPGATTTCHGKLNVWIHKVTIPGKVGPTNPVWSDGTSRPRSSLLLLSADPST